MSNNESIPPTIILAFGGPERIKPQWIEGIQEALMDIDNFLILHEAKRIVEAKDQGERWSPSKVYKALTAPYSIRTRR